MNTSDIIEQLQRLQIEQNKLIAQLIVSKSDNKPVLKNVQVTPQQKEAKTRAGNSNERVQVGDHITLLTSGVRSRKGDTARVTKTTENTIHFVVLRNGHNSFRRIKNVRKQA